MANSFLCDDAVDSRRELYYKLDWHAHWKRFSRTRQGRWCAWGSGIPWAVPVEPIQIPRTRTTSVWVEDDADTNLGAGNDEEHRDESASKPSTHSKRALCAGHVDQGREHRLQIWLGHSPLVKSLQRWTLGCTRCTHSMLVRAPRLYLVIPRSMGHVGSG